ncbi:MAG: anthranilate phosphoribosyltransferase [Candidatus Sericytochromatia bacterium]
MKNILESLLAGQPLASQAAEAVLDRILNGEVPPEVTGALLVALRMRGETPAEIVGFARALRARMMRIETALPLTLDTCGTGGDGSGLFNVSTAVALLLAGLGIPVAKHGNRAISSRCGSADVLEALGVPLLNSAQAVQTSLEQHAFGFCFAPAFHPVLKTLAPLRQNLGVRTVFNLLGPLCNPAQVTHQLLGVYDRKLTPILADVLRQLGVVEAMVVCSHDGLDELSLAAPTQVSHLKAGEIQTYDLRPEDAGLCYQTLEGLSGGDAQMNAQILMALFNGESPFLSSKDLPRARNLVAYNAAAALLISGRVDSLKAGVELALETLQGGQILTTLEKLRKGN